MNKMASSLSRYRPLSQWAFRQVCVARGSVSWTTKDNDEAGELQLWYRESDKNYSLYARGTKDDMPVCKVIDVFTVLLVSRYPAAGNCFQKTRYPAVRNFDQFSRNSSFNSSQNIRYLFRDLKRL